MAIFSELIAKKGNYAQYMIDEITHICKDLPKRGPGDEGERLACEYMADVLKKDGGCERADVESFKEHPNAFFGWIYFTVTFVLASMVLFFFLPVAGIILTALGFYIVVLQFVMYKRAIDCFFPEKTGHSVTAIKKCTGEVKARVFFNGHPDAVWNWPINNRLGGKVHSFQVRSSFIGLFVVLLLNVAATVVLAIKGVWFYSGPFDLSSYTATYSVPLFWLGIVAILFAIPLIGMYFMWDEKTFVDGANDNLTGCYMGISILKSLKDAGVELKHVEVGVIISGSEEAGLRGAKAWGEQHKGEFDDVPTWIYCYDTIHDSKFLKVNYRDLNDTVEVDKEVSDSFVNAAKELNIPCSKGKFPMFAGATDSAAFAQAGFKATGISALDTVPADYYHTMRDSYDNLSKDCLADCFAISVKCLENIDAAYSD